MGFAFNPFTGNFDQTGSGGGGSSYIDGEVQNFSALPETAGTPPVDSAYLVREAEGAWLLSRKPAGIYIRTGNTGVRADDWTYAGEFPDVFSDDKFVLYDETDSSKNLVFQLSGLTTGTTSTLTVPTSGTIARTEDFASPPAIGNTTPNSGAFTTLTANNGTLTASAPVLDLSQTWNASGVTFTGLRFNVTDADSAAASLLADFQVGGTSVTSIRKDGALVYRSGNRTLLTVPFGPTLTATAGGAWLGLNTTLASNGSVLINGSFEARGNLRLVDGTSSNPVILERDAADTLAQRRSTNPQTFRLYTTYGGTGGADFERFFIRGQTGGAFQIGTEKGGTGSARALEFQTDGVTRLTLGDAGGVTIADANNIAVGTTTGTKIGTGTTQKIGFFNATPVVQQAAIADATDAATTQARLNDLLATMRTFGLIAT